MSQTFTLEEAIALADGTTYGCGRMLSQLFADAAARGVDAKAVHQWLTTNPEASVKASVDVTNGTGPEVVSKNILDQLAPGSTRTAATPPAAPAAPATSATSALQKIKNLLRGGSSTAAPVPASSTPAPATPSPAAASDKPPVAASSTPTAPATPSPAAASDKPTPAVATAPAPSPTAAGDKA